MSSNTRLTYSSLGTFSRLFVSYCTQFDDVSEFYSVDYRGPDALSKAAENARGRTRDRETLVTVLGEQNARWGADDLTRLNIERLRQPDAVAVVTGQQVGLFTGPLYTLYKTITAIQLAREIERVTNRPTIPVFWLEGEDHDVEEANQAVFSKGNDTVEVRYPGPLAGGPVGRIRFSDEIKTVLDQVRDTLPPTSFRDDVLDLLQSAYAPGASYLDAFALLLRSMLPDQGLVFISSDDTRLKEMAKPLFKKELEGFEHSNALLAGASDRIADVFHAQIRPTPLNLFLFVDGKRRALDPDGDTIRIKGTTQSVEREELLRLAENRPERFSPNVVMRPLLQDFLLPTAAYVAGPSEVAYFAQFKDLYDWFGVPMPMIYPRAGVTLVERKVRKILDQNHLDIGDLHVGTDQVVQRLVEQQMSGDLDPLFDGAAKRVTAVVEELRSVATAADKTLERSADGALRNMLKELEGLKKRVVRAEKRKQDGLVASISKAAMSLFPGGKPQERTFTTAAFLAKYGLELPTRLLGDLSLDTTEHQVVDL